MYRLTKKIIYIYLGILYLIFPRTAYAYLDPGTGSYVLQIILAAFVGVAFTIKIYWGKIKTIFVNLFSKKSQNRQDSAE
jgi:hypothetical protein